MNPFDMMKQYAKSSNYLSEEMLGYKLQLEPIYHQRFRKGMYQIAELHHRRRTFGFGGGILLIGPSGAGKSTILKTYEIQYPRCLEEEYTRIPVLTVKVPSSPTVRSLASAMLEALGDSKFHQGTAPEKTTRLNKFIKACGVELILLDEFHHLFYTANITAFRDATDWLKNLLESSGIGMVACGLPTAELVVRSNEQLSRRFSQCILMDRFRIENSNDFLEYRALIKGMSSCLPIECDTPLHEANMARRIHTASYGLFDYTIKLLEGSVCAANLLGLKTISADVLSISFQERIWRDVPEILNPFHPESPLRQLTRPGEVFFQHTRQDSIGSPVAKKLGMKLTKEELENV